MTRILIAAAMLAALAGCGLRGDLERPPPLFGEAREQYERDQAAAAAAEAARQEARRQQQARDQLTPTSPSTVPAAPSNQ